MVLESLNTIWASIIDVGTMSAISGHDVRPEQFHKKAWIFFKKSQISDKHGKIEKQKIKVFRVIFAAMFVRIFFLKSPSYIFYF